MNNSKIKHKILGFFYRFHNETPFNIHKWKDYPTCDSVSKELGIDKEIIWFNLVSLGDNNDNLNNNDLFHNQLGKDSNFYINSRGIINYCEKTYLKIGRKEIVNDIYDYAKTISVIALLIFATTTFISTYFFNNKRKQEQEIMQSQINLINKKIDFILYKDSIPKKIISTSKKPIS